MKKVTCDKCGKQFDPNDGHFEIVHEGSGLWGGDPVDLCFDCGSKLREEVLKEG